MTLTRRVKNGRRHISGKSKSHSKQSLVCIDCVKTGLVNDGEFVRCLYYVHTEFFSDLEAAMGDLIKDLMSYEERCE